jgi:hypothetical protein
MTSWLRTKKIFKIIMRQLGNPPIKLVTPAKWDKLFPEYKIGDCYGRCSIEHAMFQIKDTIIHEALHILFRYKPHWWIECVTMKLNGIYVRGYFTKKAHRSLSDVPNIKRLRYFVRCTSERMRQLEKFK